jgi:hypothetical protein
VESTGNVTRLVVIVGASCRGNNPFLMISSVSPAPVQLVPPQQEFKPPTASSIGRSAAHHFADF